MIENVDDGQRDEKKERNPGKIGSFVVHIFGPSLLTKLVLLTARADLRDEPCCRPYRFST